MFCRELPISVGDSTTSVEDIRSPITVHSHRFCGAHQKGDTLVHSLKKKSGGKWHRSIQGPMIVKPYATWNES